MTTIAYRDGVIAADTAAYSASAELVGYEQRVMRDGHGSVFGIFAKSPGLLHEVCNWIANGKHNDYEPVLNGREVTFLEITRTGQVYYYEDSFVPMGPLVADYHAIGTGANVALGAMSMGADPKQAVISASRHDLLTQGFVQVVRVLEEEKTDV